MKLNSSLKYSSQREPSNRTNHRFFQFLKLDDVALAMGGDLIKFPWYTTRDAGRTLMWSRSIGAGVGVSRGDTHCV